MPRSQEKFPGNSKCISWVLSPLVPLTFECLHIGVHRSSVLHPNSSFSIWHCFWNPDCLNSFSVIFSKIYLKITWFITGKGTASHIPLHINVVIYLPLLLKNILKTYILWRVEHGAHITCLTFFLHWFLQSSSFRNTKSTLLIFQFKVSKF